MNDDLAQIEPLAVRPSTAAKLLDCSRTHVYQLIKSGALKTVPFGADQRILVSELKRFIAQAAA